MIEGDRRGTHAEVVRDLLERYLLDQNTRERAETQFTVGMAHLRKIGRACAHVIYTLQL